VTTDDDHPFYDETSYALSLKGFQKKPLVIAEVGNFNRLDDPPLSSNQQRQRSDGLNNDSSSKYQLKY